MLKKKKNEKTYVFFDNDGSTDDMISLFMLLNTPNVEVIGVTLIPGNCDVDIGIEANLKILTMAGKKIRFGYSTEKGKNPFPEDYKASAMRAMLLPKFINLKEDKNLLINMPAYDFLARAIIQCDEKVSVLLTGPATNLTIALKRYPQLKDNIDKVIWMGGAVDVPGNNENHMAELNCYWDPQASKELLNSGLNVVMFPLDATNQVLVTKEILVKLAQQANFDASNIVSELFATVFWEGTYFMWDMLTTAYLGTNEYVTFRCLELDISLEPETEGKVIKTPGSGTFVKVADKIDVDKYYDYFFKVLQYSFNK